MFSWNVRNLCLYNSNLFNLQNIYRQVPKKKVVALRGFLVDFADRVRGARSLVLKGIRHKAQTFYTVCIHSRRFRKQIVPSLLYPRLRSSKNKYWSTFFSLVSHVWSHPHWAEYNRMRGDSSRARKKNISVQNQK